METLRAQHTEDHVRASGEATLDEQFDDMEQRHEASMLGMWMFLTTEFKFFGGLRNHGLSRRLLDQPPGGRAG